MEGYLKDGTPDTTWWSAQITRGTEDRDLKLKASEFPTYEQFYRNEFLNGVYPKNMFFVLARTIVPKIYYRNPKVSIIPKKPGPAHAAFAKTLERVDNILMDAMNMKIEMQRMVNASFFNSMGVMKLLFGAEHSPTPIPGLTAAPLTKDGFNVEYRPGIVQNMPYIKHTPTLDFILAENIRNVEDSFFQAQRITRYYDDLIQDDRFPAFKKYAKRREGAGGISALGSSDPIFKDQEGTRRIVELLEIRDRRTQKVILLAPHDMPIDKPLLIEDDELQTPYSSPFYTYVPNMDNSHPYGVADANILLTAQEQLNDIKTKIHNHARLSLVKWLSEKGAIKAVEASKLLNEDIGAVIQVANLAKLQIVESHHIPDALLQQEKEIMEDMRELIGFSRNSMAQFQARSHGPTATEVNAVNQAAELRTDERRDMIADLVIKVFRDIHLVIFRHWTQEQVVNLTGPDGLPIWVKFTGDMLKEGSYDIQIEPDSSVPETRQVREARATALYNDMLNNPLIDARKLTEYRLRETPGVAMDDLMQPVQPAAQGNVLSMDEFAAKQTPQQVGA